MIYLLKLRIILFITFTSLMAFSCLKSNRIEGKVVDFFGQPINDVEITIENSNFKSLSDKNGLYEIDYAPGDVKLVYLKNGYSENELHLNISEKSFFPAKDIKLIQMPIHKGICLMANNKYLELPKAELRNEFQENSFSWNGILSLTKYWTFGIYRQVKQDTILYFIDNDNIDNKLFKLDNSGVIGEVQRFWSENKNTFYSIQESYSTYEKMTIRSMKLEEGKYAFVKIQNNFGNVTLEEPLYLFEVLQNFEYKEELDLNDELNISKISEYLLDSSNKYSFLKIHSESKFSDLVHLYSELKNRQNYNKTFLIGTNLVIDNGIYIHEVSVYFDNNIYEQEPIYKNEKKYDASKGGYYTQQIIDGYIDKYNGESIIKGIQYNLVTYNKGEGKAKEIAENLANKLAEKLKLGISIDSIDKSKYILKNISEQIEISTYMNNIIMSIKFL